MYAFSVHLTNPQILAAKVTHPKTEIIWGVLETECRELLQEFF